MLAFDPFIDLHSNLILLFIFDADGNDCLNSHISGQTFVGVPTEVYAHGTQYVVFVIAAIVVRFILRKTKF